MTRPVSAQHPSLPLFTTDRYAVLKISTLTADDVTVAQLNSPAPYNNVYRGSAKRHEDDAHNESIGDSLAVARALRKYADDLEKTAYKASRG